MASPHLMNSDERNRESVEEGMVGLGEINPELKESQEEGQASTVK